MSTGQLSAAPRITAGAADGPAGTVIVRPADPLGEYPATVVHSVRAWARSGPDHLMVAERAPDGTWRGCGYVNQRRVLACRAALVELLYAGPVPAGVVIAGGTA